MTNVCYIQTKKNSYSCLLHLLLHHYPSFSIVHTIDIAMIQTIIHFCKYKYVALHNYCSNLTVIVIIITELHTDQQKDLIKNAYYN